jgi:drug/metabolite transporter superfamily protein YnfA
VKEEPTEKKLITGGRASLKTMVPLLLLAAAFVARLVPANAYFLNPDEALHYLAASQTSLSLTYRAALTNAHPPLLILILHFWKILGQSEFALRIPSVLAGVAGCWLFYLWLREVTGGSVALIGLLLMSFAPSLIALSAEVRQYALLLFFVAGCLFLSEQAIRKNSPWFMVLFSLSLYGALLTHYSSLVFALTIGIYVLLRLLRGTDGRGLLALWAGGQMGAVALIVYFLSTHVRRLKAMGMPQEIAETWLRKSIFHPGEQKLIAFVPMQTLRLFTYLFSHGLVGTIFLLAFLLGIAVLLRSKASAHKGPTPRELTVLLTLPFLASCAAAIAGIYPYGGTRHNAVLAPFAIAGAAIGVAALSTKIAARGSTQESLCVRLLPVGFLLAFCNFFPAPPPLIKAKNHSNYLMRAAIDYLHQNAPPGAVVFADYESGLLFGYYGCGHGVVQIFPPVERFATSDCGSYTAISARPEEWRFKADNMQEELQTAAATYGLRAGTKVWLFDAGWINDLAPAISRDADCAGPRFFGENILICQLTVAQMAVDRNSPQATSSAGEISQ